MEYALTNTKFFRQKKNIITGFPRDFGDLKSGLFRTFQAHMN